MRKNRLGPFADTLTVVSDARPEPSQGFERRASPKDIGGDGIAPWIEVRVRLQFRGQRLSPGVGGKVDDVRPRGIDAGIPASAPLVLVRVAGDTETSRVEPLAPPAVSPVVGFQRALDDNDGASA